MKLPKIAGVFFYFAIFVVSEEHLPIQNYQNPFNPDTKIKFDIARNGNLLQDVKIVIYDALGKEVKTFVNQKLAPGAMILNSTEVIFQCGVYFINLR